MHTLGIALTAIRAQLIERWPHALKVLDIIEAKAEGDTHFASDVEQWLTDPTCSTVWLRDEIMEPLRHTPEMREVTASICRETADSLTNWHNTWMPLDTAMHRVRLGLDPMSYRPARMVDLSD